MAREDDSEREKTESSIEVAPSSQGLWSPERDDAELVGQIGEIVRDVLGERATVWQVYCVPDTWSHIVRNHGAQLDLQRAKALLPFVLQNPKIVYLTDKKPKSIVFIGEYDELHDLVVAVKSIFEKNELWLSTMHKIQNDRIGYSATGIRILYERRE